MQALRFHGNLKVVRWQWFW